MCLDLCYASAVLRAAISYISSKHQYDPIQLSHYCRAFAENTFADEEFLVYVKKVTLCYLRRMALLAYLYGGPKTLEVTGSVMIVDEVTRLVKILELPDIETILGDIWCSSSHTGSSIKEGRYLSPYGPMQGWIRCFTTDFFKTPGVVFPGPHVLFPLPNRLDTLLRRDHSVCEYCSNTDRGSRGICLYCGKTVCVQSSCCAEEGLGECNVHMKR